MPCKQESQDYNPEYYLIKWNSNFEKKTTQKAPINQTNQNCIIKKTRYLWNIYYTGEKTFFFLPLFWLQLMFEKDKARMDYAALRYLWNFTVLLIKNNKFLHSTCWTTSVREIMFKSHFVSKMLFDKLQVWLKLTCMLPLLQNKYCSNHTTLFHTRRFTNLSMLDAWNKVRL